MTMKKKQLFGTNGVRGVTGEMMTPELVLKIGMSLGTIRSGTFAVGCDTRTSGPALVHAVKAGLLATGQNVVELGILPTPALQYIVKNHYDGGIVITASHNPPEYNGVKVIEADGTEMSDEEIITLEETLFAETFSVVGWDKVGRETSEPDGIQEYIDGVINQFGPGTCAGMTVAVDPGSGPACRTTQEILTSLGCRVFSINSQMDGTFPGRLPEPSPEGLKPLADLVFATGAAFGVAHDGDADRAVFIDDTGAYLEENEEFALMQYHVCKNKPGLVVTPVSTSMRVEDVAAMTNCRVHYTKVGSISVARTMMALAAAGEPVVFGGEGNGGLIFPEHQHCRDGGMTAAAMASLLKSEGQKLSELRTMLPPRHMIKDKIFTDNIPGLLEQVQLAFAEDEQDLTDGIRINRENCWALFRPSGTEPFMRLYVEAAKEEEAQAFCDEIMAVIGPKEN